MTPPTEIVLEGTFPTIEEEETGWTVEVHTGTGDAIYIRGRPVATTVPTAGQVLAWSGSAWEPESIGSAGEIQAVADDLAAHVADVSNPHAVTAAQVGAYTTAQVDTALAAKSDAGHTHTFASLTSKPTTLAGYGITDAALASDLAAHEARTDNPHAVTKAQVGLANVENTALSTWAGSTALTTLGTITTGTWDATAVAWAKVDKTGSSLSDLTTKSAGALDSGNLAYARLPNAAGTWDVGGGTNEMVLRGRFVASAVGQGLASAFATDADAGQVADINFRKGGVNRWIMRSNGTAEAGSDTGSDFQFFARADDGSALGEEVWRIVRADGGTWNVTRPTIFNPFSDPKIRADIAQSYTPGTGMSPYLLSMGGNTANAGHVAVIKGTTTANNGPGLVFGKVNNNGAAVSSLTAVATGHLLGSIVWAGTDGTDLATQAAAIRVFVNGSVTTNRIPAEIRFYTAPAAADDDLGLRWTMTSAGAWLANGAQAIQTSTGILTLATLAGNGDVGISPHGTGRLRFGTFTASGDVAITGSIEVKDFAGTTRKLAVIA